MTPAADVARCAEQNRRDYVFFWRPNPTDMFCAEFGPQKVKSLLRDGLAAAKGCRVNIRMKYIEDVQGEPQRIRQWVQWAREASARY